MVDFSQITYDDFTRFTVLQIMYKNYYHEQLAKIRTCVKYSIDAYHWYIYPRNILLFHFGNLNSRDYQGGPLNFMFPRFPNCFLPFLLVFLHVSSGVSTVSSGVFFVSPKCSRVFYFRFCISQLADIGMGKIFKKNIERFGIVSPKSRPF